MRLQNKWVSISVLKSLPLVKQTFINIICRYIEKYLTNLWWSKASKFIDITKQ